MVAIALLNIVLVFEILISDRYHTEALFMKEKVVNLTYEINLQPGEKLTLPESVVESVGAGSWIITIQPKPVSPMITRSHDAFLKGYASEDEGLYDDYQRR